MIAGHRRGFAGTGRLTRGTPRRRFESAIVPRWGASTITFRNVYVSRHPTESLDDDDDDDDDDDAEDGEHGPDDAESTAVPQLHMVPPDDASAQALARQSAMSLRPRTARAPPDGPQLATTLPPSAAECADAARAEALRMANNYTMFDVNFEEVDVTLSLVRWLGGKGLVKEAKIRGVRGVIGAFCMGSGGTGADGHADASPATARAHRPPPRLVGLLCPARPGRLSAQDARWRL